jgi:hypothetical protein
MHDAAKRSPAKAAAGGAVNAAGAVGGAGAAGAVGAGVDAGGGGAAGGSGDAEVAAALTKLKLVNVMHPLSDWTTQKDTEGRGLHSFTFS